MEISEETGYDKIKAKIYVNLAGVHTIFGDSAVAARLMSEAFRISKEQHDWYIYTAAFIDLANHLAVNDNLAGMKDEADDFSSTSIPDSIKMKTMRCGCAVASSSISKGAMTTASRPLSRLPGT